ncbi:hypothetical protein M529_05515 [Sphingobium ummariense RL-3]|uniref:Uncharacterized protein n=1 Tax=Sphingobium ummariense RL-3 TaxID=1346791 RepID=T0J8U7_9SPHN|nr:hypothetical protein M529_05515 [Sphingobium ummariense RL-3]
MADGEQLLEQDRDLLPIGRAERIKLQGMPTDGQFLLARRTGNRTIGAGELAAITLVPAPDLQRHIPRRLILRTAIRHFKPFLL